MNSRKILKNFFLIDLGVPAAPFGRIGRVFRTSLTLILLAQVVSINSTTFSAVDRFTGAPYPYADTWILQVSGFFFHRKSIWVISMGKSHELSLKNLEKSFNFSHRNAYLLVSMGKIFKLPLKTFPISRNFTHRIAAFLIFVGKKQVYPPKN